MFFVLDENKNLIEAYDKEGVLALLEQAIEDGDLSQIEADSAFVSKLKSLINGTTHHIEFITQAQYNAMEQAGTLVPNTYYYITDDTTAEDLENAINNILNGTTAVAKATEADHATNADNAATADSVNFHLYDHQVQIIAASSGSYPPTIWLDIRLTIINTTKADMTIEALKDWLNSYTYSVSATGGYNKDNQSIYNSRETVKAVYGVTGQNVFGVETNEQSLSTSYTVNYSDIEILAQSKRQIF